VPSLVLAAMPVKYCVAAGGHRALEFVIEGVAHGGDHSSHDAELVPLSPLGDCAWPSVTASEGGCDDKSLMDLAAFSSAKLFEQQPLTAILHQSPPACSTTSHASRPQSPLAGGSAIQADPRLLAHRTVVLRI
jgi:hypothetical protein